MRVLLGDCVARMAEMPDASVVSVVCDPPYGLEFLGKDWDSFKTGRSAAYATGGELNTKNMQARSGKGGAGPAYVKRAAKRCSTCGKQQWSGSPCKCVDPEWEIDNSPLLAFQSWASVWLAEVFRVLRPGGQVKAFGGTRVFHRLGAAMESGGFTDVGVETWNYASGFPKSHSVDKALDKMGGLQREVLGYDPVYARRNPNGKYGLGLSGNNNDQVRSGVKPVTAPASLDSRTWEGWGTALKPAWEPVLVGTKPT